MRSEKNQAEDRIFAIASQHDFRTACDRQTIPTLREGNGRANDLSFISA